MGKRFWKFNNSLLSYSKFVCHMKNHIAATITFLNEENILDDQIKWEHLKYEEMNTLENNMKIFELDLTSFTKYLKLSLVIT